MIRFTWIAAVAVVLIAPRTMFGADYALLDSEIYAKGYSRAVFGVACNGYHLGENSYLRDWTAWKFALDGRRVLVAGSAEDPEGDGDALSPYRYQVIHDGEVNPARLQDFTVLILANTFALDEFQAKAIAEWVRKGGHLIATYGTGYAGVEGDLAKGGTNSLHQLWGDPSTKVNSSYFLGHPYVKVQTTQNTWTAQEFPSGSVLNYGALANIMNRRPFSSKDTYAFLRFSSWIFADTDPGTLTNYPAILYNKHSRGTTMYFAFSPEFFVALAYDTAGHCANDVTAGSETAPGVYGNPLPGIQAGDQPNNYADGNGVMWHNKGVMLQLMENTLNQFKP